MATKKKNGRKKPRSAKQKAASKRNIKKARAAAGLSNRRKAPKRKAPKRKSNKQRKTKRKTVAKGKRRAPSRKKGVLGKIPLINNPMFRQAAIGVGTATLGAAALGLVLPQFASHPVVKPVLALAAGGPIGAVAQVLIGGGIQGLGIGGGSNASSGGTINTGFA